MSKRQPLRIVMVRSGTLKQQHHLTTLCQYLVSNNIELEFVSIQAPVSEVDWFGEQVQKLKTHTLGQWKAKGIGRFVQGGWKLRCALKKMQFDILYIVDSWSLPYLFVATSGSMQVGRAAMVYHTFDMIIPAAHARMYCSLERHMLHRSQLNINTDRSRAEVAKIMFALRERPLSVPLRLLRNAVLPLRDYELRASFVDHGTPSDKFLVVYPTKLGPARLSMQVIKAFDLLPPNYHLVTIDAGGLYAQDCRDVIRCFNLGDRVHLLQPMPYEELLKLCACADLGLIFHDIDAGIGNYLCHPGRLAYFVAMGLPFVASNVPVLESLVYRYGLGLCCSPYEPADIAQAVQEICEGKSTLSERRTRIRNAFKQNLYYERSAQQLLDALKRLPISSQ